MNWLKKPSWSPYLGGILLGILIIIIFITAGRPLGASRAYITCAAMIEKLFSPAHVTNTLYFTTYGPDVEWTLMVVLGVIGGSFLSSLLSGEFRVRLISPEWRKRFGDAPGKKALFALAGGVLIGFGSRLAGGCTSGQALSGTLQLAVSGWIFFAAFFTGGAIVARLLYGRKS